MIYQELKRRLFTRYVIFSLIGILLLSIILSTLLIVEEKNLPEILKEESVYSGELTEEKLLIGLKKVKEEKSQEIRYASLVHYIYNLVKIHPGILYFENKVQDFPDEYAKNFYNCWRKKSIVLIERIPKADQEKALGELNKVKTPFNIYQGFDIWNLGVDNLNSIYLLILFMVIFYSATTYSDSFEDDSMEIISATKFRKKIMMIRLLPIIIYGILLTFIATLGTILTLGYFGGFQALKSSFIAFQLFSIGNYTLGETILLMFVSEILGILALTTLMGWISYKVKKTNIAISIGISINILYIIINSSIEMPGKLAELVLNMLPVASAQVLSNLSGYHFGIWFWRPYAVMINMIIVFIVFGILLIYDVYKKII